MYMIQKSKIVFGFNVLLDIHSTHLRKYLAPNDLGETESAYYSESNGHEIDGFDHEQAQASPQRVNRHLSLQMDQIRNAMMQLEKSHKKIRKNVKSRCKEPTNWTLNFPNLRRNIKN